MVKITHETLRQEDSQDDSPCNPNDESEPTDWRTQVLKRRLDADIHQLLTPQRKQALDSSKIALAAVRKEKEKRMEKQLNPRFAPVPEATEAASKRTAEQQRTVTSSDKHELREVLIMRLLI